MSECRMSECRRAGRASPSGPSPGRRRGIAGASRPERGEISRNRLELINRSVTSDRRDRGAPAHPFTAM